MIVKGYSKIFIMIAETGYSKYILFTENTLEICYKKNLRLSLQLLIYVSIYPPAVFVENLLIRSDFKSVVLLATLFTRSSQPLTLF